ncbi:MAG: aldolase [Candidatus Omnitrophica bacterium]|nr:aldolase [Candidatus Omnitrophota bacterium]
MTKEKNNLKKRLKSGEMVLGVWNSIPSPSLVNVIGASGVDFIIIDSEHGPINMETAEDMVRAAEVAGSAPIVRVPSNEDHLILRALDIGACGVQVPHVSTKLEAEKVVKSAKYYPEGERGLSPFTRAGGYGLKTEGYTDRANKETMVILNIEGKEGVSNIEEIATLPGIDVIFVGPYDLSQSLGIPGEVRDKKVLDAIKTCADVAAKNGIACGSFACDRAYLELLIECGVKYLTYMVDTSVIAGAYKDVCDFLKEKK